MATRRQAGVDAAFADVEADRARRTMHAAKALGRLPIGIDPSLMALRDRKPFPTSDAEIDARLQPTKVRT